MESPEHRQIWCMLAFSNMPDLYQFEQLDYFYGFFSLHQEASSFMKDQLKIFYDNYYEYFNLADYADAEERLTEEERRSFSERLQSDEIGVVFEILSEVLIQRLDIHTIESLKKSEELFNYIIDFGLSNYNEHRHSNEAATWINIGQPAEFGIFFVEHILNQIKVYESNKHYGHSAIGESMAPFRSIIEGMKKVVNKKGWSEDDLYVGRLLMLIDIYQSLVEEQY